MDSIFDKYIYLAQIHSKLFQIFNVLPLTFSFGENLVKSIISPEYYNYF